MSEPLVSVILPTYNRAALLAEALASVVAQTFEDWECIVADDGSTDGTPDVLARTADSRLRHLTMTHSGNPAVPRNAALGVARGRLLAFLDDDDLWTPEKLATQIPLLAGGRFRWSYTGFVKVDGQGRESWRSTPDRLPGGHILGALLETRAAIALPTVIAERALLAEVGGFDEALRTREDYALWLSLAERAPVAVTPERLTIVRDHAGRVFRPEANRMSLVLYQRWLDRVSDRGLRRICRRRLAETHLVEARRHGAAREWRAAALAVLHAVRSSPATGLRRVLRAAGRRARAPSAHGSTTPNPSAPPTS
jgi:glycosyltransferase involved in cell wall biosynthesis